MQSIVDVLNSFFAQMRLLMIPGGVLGLGFVALAFAVKPILGDKLAQHQSGYVQTLFFVLAAFGFIPAVVAGLVALGPSGV